MQRGARSDARLKRAGQAVTAPSRVKGIQQEPRIEQGRSHSEGESVPTLSRWGGWRPRRASA